MLVALFYWLVGTVAIFLAVRIRGFPLGLAVFAPFWFLVPLILLFLAIRSREGRRGR